jgi:hypothetical protein
MEATLPWESIFAVAPFEVVTDEMRPPLLRTTVVPLEWTVLVPPLGRFEVPALTLCAVALPGLPPAAAPVVLCAPAAFVVLVRPAAALVVAP